MRLENTSHSKYYAIIEKEDDIGFYLYIFEKSNHACVKDHLQDTLSIAVDQALEDYEFKKEDWVKTQD